MKTSLNRSADVCILVNDVFDLLKCENIELKNQIKILNEFKAFFDEICLKLKSYLNDNELNRLKILDHRLSQCSQLKDQLEQRFESYADRPQDRPKGCVSEHISDCHFSPIESKELSKNRRPKRRYRKSKSISISHRYICDSEDGRHLLDTPDNDGQHKHSPYLKNTTYQCEWPGCDFSATKKSLYNQHIDNHKGLFQLILLLV